jgi:parvulin-like peptidyl-prolyl isomerase
MRECIFVLISMFIFIGGCSGGSRLTDAELEHRALTRKIRLVEATGGLVLIVGGETVTSEEIIRTPVEMGDQFIPPIEHFKTIAQASELERFKELARRQLKEVLTSKILYILLYQEAKREIGENIDEVLKRQSEKALREYVLGFDGDQIKADEALKKRGMDRDSYKEYHKRMLLIQWYVSSKTPNNRPITHRELMDGYEQMKDKYFVVPGVIKFRLIDIQPDKVEVADPNEDPHKLAKELADDLIKRIQSGEDFGKLARQYSYGPMKEFGGLWRPVQPESLAEPYDKLAAAAKNLEVGQIADLIVTPEHLFIMKLEERHSDSYEPFEKVQMQVREKINSDRRINDVSKVNAELLRHAEMGETDEFIDFCLEKIYQESRK